MANKKKKNQLQPIWLVVLRRMILSGIGIFALTFITFFFTGSIRYRGIGKYHGPDQLTRENFFDSYLLAMAVVIPIISLSFGILTFLEEMTVRKIWDRDTVEKIFTYALTVPVLGTFSIFIFTFGGYNLSKEAEQLNVFYIGTIFPLLAFVIGLINARIKSKILDWLIAICIFSVITVMGVVGVYAYLFNYEGVEQRLGAIAYILFGMVAPIPVIAIYFAVRSFFDGLKKRSV